MDLGKKVNNRIFIHLSGFILLLAVHFIADFYHFQQRTGLNKFLPYLFLLMLYGWIVFHNLILFDGLYLTGKKKAYFVWTAIALLIGSLNIYVILLYGFDVYNPWPQIINYWIYTLLGLGIYMIYRYLRDFQKKVPLETSPATDNAGTSCFSFMADSEKHHIPYEKILFLESLENYIRIHTQQKAYIARLPLKEAEQCLPTPLFIRISRSHIINASHILAVGKDSVRLGDRVFKIGKVYKKYVEEQLGK